MKRRSIAWVMALMMIFTSLPTNVFASADVSDFTDIVIDDISAKDAEETEIAAASEEDVPVVDFVEDEEFVENSVVTETPEQETEITIPEEVPEDVIFSEEALEGELFVPESEGMEDLFSSGEEIVVEEEELFTAGEDSNILVPGETISVEVGYDEDEEGTVDAEYFFTPSSYGRVRIYAESDYDTVLNVYKYTAGGTWERIGGADDENGMDFEYETMLDGGIQYKFAISTYEEDTVTFDVTFEFAEVERPDVSSVTLEGPDKFAAGWESTSVPYAIQAVIAYSDDTTAQVNLGNQDIYGNIVQYQIYQNGEVVDAASLSAGEYTIKASVGDISAEMTINGVDVLEVAEALPINVYKEDVTVPTARTQFYTLSVSKKEKYAFEFSSRFLVYLDLYKSTDGVWQKVQQYEMNDEPTIVFEPGEYLLQMYYCDYTEGTEPTVFDLFVETRPCVSSFAFVSDQQTEFIPALEELSVEVVVTYTNGKQETFTTDDEVFEYTLYEVVDDAKGEEVDLEFGEMRGDFILEASLNDNPENLPAISTKIHCGGLNDLESTILYENDPIQVTISGRGMKLFTFTPQQSGYYKFDTDDTACDVNVFNTDEESIDEEEFSGKRAKLTAESTYYVILQSYASKGLTCNFTVKSTERPEIEEISLHCGMTEMVSGVDDCSSGISVKITYTDGTTRTLGDWYVSDYYGNEVSIKVTDADGNEEFSLDECQSWAPGTYLLQAECNGVLSNQVTVNVKAMDTSEFTELKAGTFYTVSESVYYKFVPEEDVEYHIVSESGVGCSTFYLDENGTLCEFYDEEMTAGQVYLLSFYAGAKVMITSSVPKEELQLGVTKTFESVGGLKKYIFRVPEAGKYRVTAKYDTVAAGTDSCIRVDGYWSDGLYPDADGNISAIYTFEEEGELYFTVYPAGVAVTLCVEEAEAKKAVDFEIIAGSTKGFSTYFDQNQTFIDGILIKFEDGTYENVTMYNGDYIENVKTSKALVDGEVVHTYEVKVIGIEETKTLTATLDKEIPNILKENETIEAVAGAVYPYNSNYICEFTPETTGRYYLNAKSSHFIATGESYVVLAVKDEDKLLDSSNVIESDSGRYLDLEAGITYVMRWTQYGKWLVEQFEIVKYKDVQKLELKTPAKDFCLTLPYIYEDSMTAIATYEDGTTAEISAADGNYDAYGNYVSFSQSQIHDGKAIIYLKCGNKWVSCVVADAGAESLTLLKQNVVTEIDVKNRNAGVYFVPETSGKYNVVWGQDHNYYYQIVDAETGKELDRNAELVAGKTYLCAVSNGYGSMLKETVSLVLVKSADTCTGEHDFIRITDKESTCKEAGSVTDICKNCGIKLVTTLPLAHIPGEWIITKEATALEAGEKVQKCTACGEIAVGPVVIEKLTPTMTVNVTAVTVKEKEKVTSIAVSGLAKADYVASWKSSNTGIFTVDANGVVTGVKAGSAVLTITLASGLSKNIPVTVKPAIIRTTAITGLKSAITLKKGTTVTLAPKKVPTNSQEAITFKSSNTKVAIVSSKGVVKAVRGGKAIITVTSGAVSKNVTITVPVTKTTKITGVSTAYTVKKGATITLKAKPYPTNSDYGVAYKSLNTKIVTVTSKGVVKGIKAGSAYIQITSGTIKKNVKITVPITKTTKITGVSTAYTVKKGATITLKAKPYPTNSDYGISYKSLNTAIATVTSKGVVKGIKAGATYIQITSGTIKRNVKITVPKTPTTKITGVSTAYTVKKGATITLRAKAYPTTSDYGVSYKSLNTAIATVTSKGVVKAVRAGATYIQITSGTVKLNVKITVPKTATTKITGVSTAYTVARGKTITLRAKAYPTTSDYGVTYKSLNTKIATVTSKGVVKGIKAGTTYIQITSGTIKKNVKITVK